MSFVGEVWKRIRLEAVDKVYIAFHSRSRVWLPAKPSSAGETEEILRSFQGVQEGHKLWLRDAKEKGAELALSEKSLENEVSSG